MLARGQMDGAQQEAAIARENFPARLAAAQAQQASAEANLFKAQTDDARQIRRWKAIRRHVAQVKRNCECGDPHCRPRQRQALLHWAYDSRKM